MKQTRLILVGGFLGAGKNNTVMGNCRTIDE